MRSEYSFYSLNYSGSQENTVKAEHFNVCKGSDSGNVVSA